MKDGRLMMIGQGKVCYSSDMGKSWCKPQSLPIKIDYAIRLNSGWLAGPATDTFYASPDEGVTWQKRGKIYVSNIPASPYPNTMIQASTGRLFLPVRFESGAAHISAYNASMSWGTHGGKLVQIEGHAHSPEPDIAFVYYSDDEGNSWKKSEGGVMIWHREGYGGMWPCDEPSVVETRGKNILMFCRTTLGRIYVAASEGPNRLGQEGNESQMALGLRFGNPAPTTLSSSYSPCVVRRIPKTDDLLIVWNQVSAEEIRAGYRRGRLSSAISKDDGRTWQHFRTIDTSVLPPSGRIEQGTEPQMVRALDYIGILPREYGSVDYPTFEIVDDRVFLAWNRTQKLPPFNRPIGRRFEVFPLSFFYGKDENQRTKSPRLFLKVPGGESYSIVEIPSKYFRGTFYCSSKHLTMYLKSPIGSMQKDVYGPLHQVISILGWMATYDDSNLSDSNDPRMIVTVSHPHSGPYSDISQ
jgi:hypothetical protein